MKSKNQMIPQSPLLTLLIQMNRLIQKILCRQEGKLQQIIISRSYISMASTFFLILFSLLPYADIFINPFINTNEIKMERFPNLSTAIWSYAMCITPPLILFASKFKPFRIAYIVPCYVYTSMLCGFLFLELNINLQSDFLFRLIAFILSIIIFIIARFLLRLFEIVKYKEDVMNEMINMKRHG